jgi:hypothetical protein
MPYGAHVAVLGARFAERAFGSAAAAIGQSIVVNGRALQVIGILDPAFAGIDPFSRLDVFIPGATYAHVNHFSKPLTRDNAPILYYVARLTPDATFDGAQAELNVLLAGLAAAAPERNQAFKTATARISLALDPRRCSGPITHASSATS